MTTGPEHDPLDGSIPDRSTASDVVPHLADSVAAAALSVPGVTDLHSGAFGEVATYLPGRRVLGVRLADDVAEVHVVVKMGSKVLAVAEAVRRTVDPLVTTPVDVYVEDVAAG